MPYSVTKPPEWLKNLPAGAVRIGVDAFNAVLEQTGDEEKARKASWAAVKTRYEKTEDGTWTARADFDPGSERGGTIRFRASQADDTGLVWEAVLIAPGLSLGAPRFFWTEEVLSASAELFSGVDVCAYELTADFFSHLPIPNVTAMEEVKRYLTARKVGWIEKTWYEPGVGIKGIIRFVPEHAWLPRTLSQGMQSGNEDVLGLSIDARVRGVEVVIDDWAVIWVVKIVGASSVDVVTRPAAGGKFLRAVAGLYEEEKLMDRDKLIKLIQEVRPDLLDGKDPTQLGDDEILAAARQAMEPPKANEKDPGSNAGNAGDGDPNRAAQGLTIDQIREEIAKAALESEQRAACGQMLRDVLESSGLPEMTVARIRTNFTGRNFTRDELDAAVKTEREYLAAMSVPESMFQVPSQVRVSGGIGQRQKIEMAVDSVFGLTPEHIKTLSGLRRLDGKPVFGDLRAAQDYDAIRNIPMPCGIRELYLMLTGDTEIRGMFDRQGLPADLRAAQDITSGTFSFILGNTLSRRLVVDYLAANYREDLLVSIRKPVRDFRTQEAVMVGYFGDIATVDPEAADYQEIAAVTDEESTYAILQKGNILTITRKTIINDDMTLVQRLVSRLGRAARRTHAKYVWSFFVNNANCSDGTAWFTNPHGNLGAAALSFATAITAYQALAKMTEKDSGEIIGLLDDPNTRPTLVYPVDLMPTGESIVNDEFYYSANDLTTKTRNPLRGKLSGFMASFLSDANDWGMILPSSVVDIVEMGYLNGRQEPEMFLADSPQAEQVFVADKIRYKIRHEYAGALIDYRSGYKAIVG